MIYVALLRGVNVGGKARVEMAKLAATFQSLGYKNVRTYINSGNVVFTAPEADPTMLAVTVESAITARFQLEVPVVVRTKPNIDALVAAIPEEWANGEIQKTDVLFLWSAINQPSIKDQFKIKPDIERLLYVDGALVWNVDRAHINQGTMLKIVGTATYKQVTIRNINTVRKLAAIMAETPRE